MAKPIAKFALSADLTALIQRMASAIAGSAGPFDVSVEGTVVAQALLLGESIKQAEAADRAHLLEVAQSNIQMVLGAAQ